MILHTQSKFTAGYKSDVFFRTLRSWWQLNDSNIEHVRIVIDQNYESDQNNNTASFLIVSFKEKTCIVVVL